MDRITCRKYEHEYEHEYEHKYEHEYGLEQELPGQALGYQNADGYY